MSSSIQGTALLSFSLSLARHSGCVCWQRHSYRSPAGDTHKRNMKLFFFFSPLGEDKRFTPPKIQRDAAAILESTPNICTCLFVQFFPAPLFVLPRATMKTFGKRWTPSRPHYTGGAGLVLWLTEESGCRNCPSLLSNPSQLQRSSNMCPVSSPKDDNTNISMSSPQRLCVLYMFRFCVNMCACKITL